MPEGWYNDPFTDHLQRYWTGESWTKETRPRPDMAPPPAPPGPPPGPGQPPAWMGASNQPTGDGPRIVNYLIPSIIALLCCAWPLAIPALIFSIKSNSAMAKGDVEDARTNSNRARFWLILSAALGVVVWIYISYVLATTETPIDQGNLTPFGS